MQKMLQFYEKNKEIFGVSYLTFKKYIFENKSKYEEVMKIVENEKRKSYFITDEKKFIEIFKA